MCSVGVLQVSAGIGDALQPLDAQPGFLDALGGNHEILELLLEVSLKPRGLLFRLESGPVDRAVTGRTAIDARSMHVVKVDKQVVEDDLIDLQRGTDEVEHGGIEQHERRVLLDGCELRPEPFNGGVLFGALALDLGDRLPPPLHPLPRGIAVAGDLLEHELQIFDTARLFLIGALLGFPPPAPLLRSELRVIPHRVESRLGEPVVLIRGVVPAFPALQVSLRLEKLFPAGRDRTLLLFDLTIEPCNLGAILRVACGAKVGADLLLLQPEKRQLEPLPAARVVVHHHRARNDQQSDARHREDLVELRDAVVVRNRLLRLHMLKKNS